MLNWVSTVYSKPSLYWTPLNQKLNKSDIWRPPDTHWIIQIVSEISGQIHWDWMVWPDDHWQKVHFHPQAKGSLAWHSLEWLARKLQLARSQLMIVNKTTKMAERSVVPWNERHQKHIYDKWRYSECIPIRILCIYASPVFVHHKSGRKVITTPPVTSLWCSYWKVIHFPSGPS